MLDWVPGCDSALPVQFRQVDTATAPTAPEYVFLGQSWQAALLLAPLAPLHVPAGQAMHVEMLLASAVVEYVPGPHSTHPVCPGSE